MALTLNLPTLDAHPANRPETHPTKVSQWLATVAQRDPAEAARVVGDALAATNRVPLSERRRLDLAERYWATSVALWPLLEHRFAQASHPLTGEALESAKAALSLSNELSVAFKHLLAHAAERRRLLGGTRLVSALIQRCLQSMSRTITNSYLAYSPVPPKTWLDAHRIYAFARERGLHQQPIAPDQPDVTPERVYIQVLLLALANPYGFMPGQLHTVIRYLQTQAHWAKLTDLPPVHRMAKAVAIIPVGHDFPPFSANKGGAIEGSKLFLLTFDLAFQIQEQLRSLEAGAAAPAGVSSRRQYIALLKRLLRQWAIPPARQFNRLPSRARVVICTGLAAVWQYSRGVHEHIPGLPASLPPMAGCQVVNHTPAGYALRQTDGQATALRIADLVALKVEGRHSLQVAIIRWFRNTLKGSGLEFGCELLSDQPQAAAAVPEGARGSALIPVVVLPANLRSGDADPAPAQVVVPAATFRIEQALSLRHGGHTQIAVLTKRIDQGPGFELYEFTPVE